MKPEDQQIAIAEACGWKSTEVVSTLGTFTMWIPPGKEKPVAKLPDYLNDLNAMHLAWCGCIYDNEELEDKFSIELLRTVGAKDPDDDGRPNGSDATWLAASNSSARQRAEAFLRTLNLWKEQP